MKSRKIAIALLSAAFFVGNLFATETVVHERQIKLHHLTGVIVDPRGFPVEYAVVELCDPNDHHVLASTFADAQGRFSFADQKRGHKFEIRASSHNFNLTIYNVVIRELGKSKIRIVLSIAT